jgi:hypothetical protein
VIRSVSALLLAFALTASALPAQTDSALTRGPDGHTRSRTPGIVVLPYPDLPFFGSYTTVRTVVLPDGSTVTTSVTSKVARDSQGRLFRESHRFAPLNTDPRKTLIEFYIFDTPAHTRTTCVVFTKHCVVTRYRPQLSFAEMPVGPFDNGRRFLSREALGQKTIEDLNVIGTRETETIAPGTLGNDKQLTLTRDFWYSPDLKTNLQVLRSDPREGIITVQLNLDSRSDPDPSTFAVPSGYTVESSASAPEPLD